jgi:uncharacterized protein YecE (DUF72 family)
MMFLGTSGWSYDDWVGNTYPEGTGRAGMLRAYAAQFPTVEIDSTFYGIPRESAVRRWAEETPEHFIFAAKVPQRITHEKQLADCDAELRAFCGRMRLLGDKLGPLLLQFPYSFRADLEHWKAVLERIAPGLATYGYFNNHYAGHSPSTLRRFAALLQSSPGF